MMNENSRTEVSMLLQEAFGIDDGRVLYSLKEKASEYGLAPSDIDNIWNGTTGLAELKVWELCLIYQTVRMSYPGMPEVTAFFTDTEMDSLKKQVKRKRPESDITVINSAFPLKTNEWIAVMSMSEIIDIDNNNKIRYNRETQRPAVFRVFGDTVTEKNFLNPKEVAEIAGKLVTGQYHPDPITLNVLNDGTNTLDYNANDRTLTIKGLIDIPDGYHRNAAMHRARRENKSCNMNFPVIVTFLDVAGAQDLLAQRNKGTKIDERYTKALETTPSNEIVNGIMRDPRASSIYKTRIVKTIEEIHAGGLILFYELSEAIKSEYKLGIIAKPSTITDLTNWLVDFFNEMTDIFAEDWQYSQRKSGNWKAYHGAFIGYVIISASLYGLQDWKKHLREIIAGIDFNRENLKHIDFDIKKIIRERIN